MYLPKINKSNAHFFYLQTSLNTKIVNIISSRIGFSFSIPNNIFIISAMFTQKKKFIAVTLSNHFSNQKKKKHKINKIENL